MELNTQMNTIKEQMNHKLKEKENIIESNHNEIHHLKLVIETKLNDIKKLALCNKQINDDNNDRSIQKTLQTKIQNLEKQVKIQIRELAQAKSRYEHIENLYNNMKVQCAEQSQKILNLTHEKDEWIKKCESEIQEVIVDKNIAVKALNEYKGIHI